MSYKDGAFDLLNGPIPNAPASTKNKKKKKKNKKSSQNGKAGNGNSTKNAAAPAPAVAAPVVPKNLSPIDQMIQVHGYTEETVMMAWGQLKLKDPKTKVSAETLLAKLEGRELVTPPPLESEPEDEKHVQKGKGKAKSSSRAAAAAAPASTPSPAASNPPAAKQQTAVAENVSRFSLEQSLSSWDLTTQEGLNHLVSFAERLRASQNDPNPQSFFKIFQSSNGLEILTQQIATGYFLAGSSGVSQLQLERAIINIFDIALGDGNNQFHRWLVQSLKSLSGVLRASENNSKYAKQIGKIINANRVAQRTNSQLLRHINKSSSSSMGNSGSSLEELLTLYFGIGKPDEKDPSLAYLEKAVYSGNKLDGTSLLISEEAGAVGKLKLEDTYTVFQALDQEVQRDIARIRAARDKQRASKTMLKAEKTRLDKVAKNELAQRNSARLSLAARQSELLERKRALEQELQGVNADLQRVGDEMARIDAPASLDANAQMVDQQLDELSRLVLSFDKEEACGNSIRSLTVEAFDRLKTILNRNTERLHAASSSLGTSYYRELELHLEQLIALNKFLLSRTAWCKEQLQSQPALATLGLDDNLNKHLSALKLRCSELISQDADLLSRVEKRVAGLFGSYNRLLGSKLSPVVSEFGERSLTDMINRLGAKGAPAYLTTALTHARATLQKRKQEEPAASAAAAAAPQRDMLGLGLTISETNGPSAKQTRAASSSSAAVVGKPKVTAAPVVDNKAVAKPSGNKRNNKKNGNKAAAQPAATEKKPAAAAPTPAPAPAAQKAAPAAVAVRVAAPARAWSGWGAKPVAAAAAASPKSGDGSFPGLPAAAPKPQSETASPAENKSNKNNKSNNKNKKNNAKKQGGKQEQQKAAASTPTADKKQNNSRRNRRKTGKAGAGAQE